MNFDFSALLLILSVVSGAIWAFDAWYAAPRRTRELKSQAAQEGKEGETDKTGDTSQEPLLVEYAKSFFPIFVIVLVLRSFVFEPFRIPSASMMPTLLKGDFILVNKYDYGIRLPVLNRKIIDYKTPRRGDVVVFRYPEDPDIPYIKRVIGVPGDRIEYRDKTVYINGKAMSQAGLGNYFTEASGWVSWRQENLETIEHEILVNPGRNSHNGYPYDVVDVPDGHYFVVGDNRDNSRDSRYWGLVPDENLMGRAVMIWMNWRFEGIWNIPSWDVQLERIGTIIR